MVIDNVDGEQKIIKKNDKFVILEITDNSVGSLHKDAIIAFIRVKILENLSYLKNDHEPTTVTSANCFIKR